MSLLDFLKNDNAPKVNIMENINVDSYTWCNSAVIFEVKNGKSSLKHLCGNIDDDYCYKSQLLLNGFPLLQAENPYCPTCSGLLATGYGIENIDCEELDLVRKNINSEFVDIKKSADILKPLLGLLSDGIYILADIPHYPVNGDGKFFYNISNELTKVTATCSSYYNHDFLTVVDGFPAYLYPTQSDTCINRKRVDYYVELLKNSKNPPRAIAYYEDGFISALLDGHHKAIAAAILGVQINCLTIIKGCECSYTDENGNKEDKILFSSIEIPNQFKYNSKPSKANSENIEIQKYQLIHNALTDITPKVWAYLTVDELANVYTIIRKSEISDELIDSWLNDRNTENMCRLEYVLIYYSHVDKEKAYSLAKKIIADGSPELPVKAAYKSLLTDKDPQTEKLFIDYLVDHSGNDACSNIVNSYWD